MDDSDDTQAPAVKKAPTAPRTKPLLGATLQPPPAAPTAQPARAMAEQFWTVDEDFTVPRKSGPFLLRRGKVISGRGYDVPYLQSLGVKLTPVQP